MHAGNQLNQQLEDWLDMAELTYGPAREIIYLLVHRQELAEYYNFCPVRINILIKNNHKTWSILFYSHAEDS